MRFLLLMTWCLGLGAVEIRFTVMPERILRGDADSRLGINLNYLRDAQANRTGPARPLEEALTDLGARWLRYPGGEKSDFHRFAAPPYTTPAPRALGWYAEQGGTLVDFDAYIALCRRQGAEPLVVVACDSPERTGTTWDEQRTHAEAWVRYANVTRGYGVRRWEIGNENWWNKTAPPAAMAVQVRAFAAAMKQVDPGILVGASGNDAAWWRDFLPATAPVLDFLTVSVYPCWGWKGPQRLATATPQDLIGPLRAAVQAVEALPAGADRDRLRVVVSECNSVDYSPEGWPKTNDLGHALATFAILGALLEEPRVSAALVWNTRWVDDREAPGNQFYALDGANRLLPTGQALALWTRHLRPSLVQVAGAAPGLVVHAGVHGGGRTVWIENRGETAVPEVLVDLAQPAATTATRQTFAGRGWEDPAPVLGAPVPVTAVAGVVRLTCPERSVTVLTCE